MNINIITFEGEEMKVLMVLLLLSSPSLSHHNVESEIYWGMGTTEVCIIWQRKITPPPFGVRIDTRRYYGGNGQAIGDP